MILKTVVVGAFQCNCRILVCSKTGDALLVDPGDEAPKIIEALEGLSAAHTLPINVKYLLHTHAHLDHIGATRGVKEHLKKGFSQALVSLHRDDQDLYQGLKMQGQLFGIEYQDPVPVEHFLEDEQTLELGEMKLSIVHTPGHSPGGVSIRLHENSAVAAQELVFTGDTLFQGSIGRTDLWGGNQDLLIKSIKQRLLTLDGDIRVCPGHGPDSKIGIEKKSNPFLR